MGRSRVRSSHEPGDLPDHHPHSLRGKVRGQRRAPPAVLLTPSFPANAGVFSERTILNSPSLLFGAGLLLSCFRVYAAPGGELPPDSLHRSYTLNEIVVTATRADAPEAAVPSNVSTISRATLEAKPGSLLAAGLAGIPGVSFRTYGSGASLQTVSIRGMSPDQSLVLLDGQRYNSYQNGLVDFGLLSSSNVDRIEVVRGGYSALYGSDAMGGVINIITRRPPEGFTAGASTSIGSNSLTANEVSIGASTGSLGIRAMLRREQGRGDYAFLFNDGRTTTELTRTGEDFNVLTADARVEFDPAPPVKSFVSYSFTDADRGSPGVVTDVSSQGRARLGDRMGTLRGGIDWMMDDRLTLSVKASGQYSYETYTDPGVLINGEIENSYYMNRVFAFTPEAHFTLSPGFGGNAGLELARAGIESNDINPATRIQRSFFVTTRHVITLPWLIPHEMILYPSIRYDSFSDVTGDVSPRLGLNLGVLESPLLRLRASYGRSFRAPVFNDLYWKTGGNPSLRPERATAFDAGLVAELPLAGTLRIDASYFVIDASDRIVWIPGPGGLWSPVNITAVRSRGVETEAVWTGFSGALTLTVNSTWSDVRKTSADYPGDPTQGKHLIYTPGQTAFLSAICSLGGADLVLQHSWVSYRYTTEFNDRYLPGYRVTSAAIRYWVPLGSFKAWVKGEVNNIFNTSYQVIALYPMPLREFRATLGVEL